MSQSYKTLTDRFHRIAQIDHANFVMGWDQMVMMPPGGVEARGTAVAELRSMRHELLTQDDMSDLLDGANAELCGLDPDQQAVQAVSIAEMRRSWLQASAIPASLVKAKVLAGTRCEHAWRTQRTENDWDGFLGNFREVVALSREEARCRQAASATGFDTPYDALLDLYCAGDSQALIGDVFASLKDSLPALLQRIMEHQQGEGSQHASSPSSSLSSSLTGPFAVDSQIELNRRLMSRLGFDFQSGRLDVSMHPFSTGVAGDQRITTRFRESDIADALQATSHETGHASYEAGLPAQYRGLPVGGSRNMCLHESQSLLFEKHLFLSLPFLEAFINDVHDVFPHTAGFGAREFWQSQTKVEPTFIRVEADEVTYPMHVMLRYDIESALINGSIEPDVIPEVWDSSMKDYLGLSTGGDHLKGCLQDIHWTDGSFGYFPSYTMGAINAAQIAATIKASFPDWQERWRGGDINFLRDWLSTNLWQMGSFHSSQELMQGMTGSGSQADSFIAHLEARYLQHEY